MAKLNLTTQQPEYYADGGNSDDGTVTLSEEQLVYVVRFTNLFETFSVIQIREKRSFLLR